MCDPGICIYDPVFIFVFQVFVCMIQLFICVIQVFVCMIQLFICVIQVFVCVTHFFIYVIQIFIHLSHVFKCDRAELAIACVSALFKFTSVCNPFCKRHRKGNKLLIILLIILLTLGRGAPNGLSGCSVSDIPS